VSDDASAPQVRRLRGNLLATYGVYAVSFASGLVVTPVVYHALGQEEFGLWSFLLSATVLLTLLDLGVAPTVVRFAAAYRGAGEEERTSELASVGLVVYAVVGSLSLLLGCGLAAIVPWLTDVPDDLVTEVRLATLLLVLAVGLRLPLGLFVSLLSGRQRYDVVNWSNAVAVAVYAVSVVVVLSQGGGIVVVAALFLGMTLLRLALPLLFVWRELPFLRLRSALVTRARVRQLLTVSGHNAAIHLAAKVVFSTDVIVVGIVLGPAAAALYAIPARLFELLFGLGTAGPGLLYPAYAELEGGAQPERQRRLLLTGLRVGMGLALALGLPLVLMPDLLISSWIGPGLEESTAVGVLLGLALVVRQPAHMLTQFLIARGAQRPLARIVLAAVAVNLAGSVLLAWAVGLWGVALSTLVTELVVGLLLIPALVRRNAGIRPGELAVAVLRPVPGAILVAAVVLVGVARLVEPDSLLVLAPVGVLWLAALGPVLWRFGLERGEREEVRRRLLARRSRPALVLD
jgi:O-antigen/teichoic acid export membrane protein